jgi:alpha-tubulin suppressor-like RCC1 family protein
VVDVHARSINEVIKISVKKSICRSWLRHICFALLVLLSLGGFCAAQTNPPSGTLASRGTVVLPYLPPGTRFTAISAGEEHVIGLTSNGTVVVWGNWGGNADRTEGQTSVPAAAKTGVTAVAAGLSQNLALKSDGSLVGWGNDTFATNIPVAAQTGVVAIAVGRDHSVVLKNDGSVLAWTWTNNTFSQMDVPAEAKSGVVAIAAAGFIDPTILHGHTVALKSDGSVIAWGDNTYGQTDVPIAARNGVTAISAGPSHTVALTRDGSVLAWGDNTDGQTDVPTAARNGVAAIAAGGFIEYLFGGGSIAHGYTVALKSDGSVVVWGYNANGQTEVPPAAQRDVVAIAAGGGVVYAIKSDGSPVAWGYNWETMVPGFFRVKAE